MSMKPYRLIITLISISGIVGAGAAVAAFASSPPGRSGASSSSAPGQAQPAGGVAAPDAVQLGAFVALRRPAMPADQRLSHDQAALQTLASSQASAQANPSLARNVYAGADGSVFLAPGAGSMCILVSGSTFGRAATCATNAQAISGGLGFVYYSTDPSGQVSDFTVAGVFPDGAHDVQIVDDAGHATSVSLSQDNGYWVTVTKAVTLTWQSADGAQHSMPLRPAGGGVNPSSGG